MPEPVQALPDELPWTGERYVPSLRGDIALEHLHRYLFARALTAGLDVLDVACGEGYGASILAGTARSVIGVDIAPGVVEHAARRYPGSNLSFQQGDCAALPLPDCSRDVIVSFETLEHHGRHEEMLGDFKRVLRPGGIAVISTPDKETYGRLQERPNEFHVKELSRDQFESLLRRHFRHVRMMGQRRAYGSMLAPQTGPEAAQGWRDESAEREDAVYLVAVASDQPLAGLPASFLDGTSEYQQGRSALLRDLANARDRLARLEQSIFWRMTFPLRWLRELFR